MTPDPTPRDDLQRELTGLRALLLDMDGVVVLRGAVIPGAAEALASLEARSIPYVIATNTSLYSRATLSRELRGAGLAVGPERIVSAASVAAGYCRRHFPDAQLYVLGAPDGLAEFDGLRLLSHREAAEPDARAAAVVIGDAAEEFTPRNMQSAFTLLRNGARFVAMHKNRWWLTQAEVLLDAGAYVTGLEYAIERRALVTGKPSRAFFAGAVRVLAAVPAAVPPKVPAAVPGAGSRLSPREVAMVGDDLWNDVRGAQRAGLRGVFVLSGKHGAAELAHAAAERPAWAPDAVAPSIAEVVAALDDPPLGGSSGGTAGARRSAKRR
jgi:HAD superfamily hydrolase (TIGR01450 family)